MPNSVLKNTPNAITCANLFTGCVGLVFAFNGNLELAAYAIFIAALFDFFDGLAARLFNAFSIIGKDLDSLADMVSFGVLPGVILYQLFLKSGQIEGIGTWKNYIAFLIPVFSAIRLAKFNNDSRQTENFIGLPTPANAILISSLPFILNNGNSFFTKCLQNSYFLLAFTAIMCLLLVLEVPMLSLKFKSLNFKKNIFRYLLLLISAFAILFFKFAAVPIIIVVYILLSVLHTNFVKQKDYNGKNKLRDSFK